MKTRLTSLIIIIILFAACTTKLYQPAEQNVNKVETASLSELNQGYELYRNHCGKCHKLYRPESYTSEQWTKILGIMGPKARLNAGQVDMVHKYLVNH